MLDLLNGEPGRAGRTGCATLAMVAWLVTLASLTAGGCRSGCVGTPRSRVDGPYDVTPLLSSLRDDVRRALPARLGRQALSELPLYDLQLAIDDRTLRIIGRCRLHYRNATGQPLGVLPLLLHPNAPREFGVEQAGSLQVDRAQLVAGAGKVTLVRRRPTLVELRFDRPVLPGGWIVVDLVFSGQLRRLPADANDIFSQALASLGMLSGGGASDYGLLAAGDGLLTIASAYPMVAPFGEGGFDTEPPGRFGDLAYNGLANFRVRITAPTGMTVVTNLADESPRPAGAGAPADEATLTVNAVGAANRDLAVVAGRQLRRASQQVGPVRVTSTFLARDTEGGQRALRTAAGALELFQERFGDYPYTELDVAQATLVGGAGGVEFPGMVLIAGMLYRQPSRAGSPLAALLRLVGGLGDLLRDPEAPGESPSVGLRQMDEVVAQMARFTVAHEVAHQYFAGVVGVDCRRHAVVDEPLAQYAAGQYLQAALGEAGGQQALATNAKMNYAVYRMLGGADLPAAQPVDRFPSALAYAAMVYGKAPYFYVELERRLGRQRLQQVLRGAIDDYRFGPLATVDGWTEALARHAARAERGRHADAEMVRQLARRWFHERRGDEDLAVDGSGRAVLEQLLGRHVAQQLEQALGAIGLRAGDLFRMLLGGQVQGAEKDAGGERRGVGDLLDSLLRGLR